MPETAVTELPKTRLASLDAYRGFVMFLMAAELLRLPGVAKYFPDSRIWQSVKFQSEHVTWTGCSLHDLIQPSFSFMVGVALPFSLASRAAKEQSKTRMWLHALWRSLALVLLGVFLRSTGKPMTNWTFEDTLSQIGLGYPFLFALGFAGNRLRWTALAIILAGYWAFFAMYPLPPPNIDYKSIGVPSSWSDDFTGFAAHWNINTNAAWAFDRWFLNLFQRPREFIGNAGGYSTLSFIPTLGTMILGLIAGQWLKNASIDSAGKESAASKMLMAGMACIAAGWFWHVSGLCPSVKKIWTPAWTLFSGGWCFLMMAAFYWVMDLRGWKRWAYPLTVIGMNSIAMYVMTHTLTGFIGDALRTHLGRDFFARLAKLLDDNERIFEPMIFGACILLVLWLIVWWMSRRKIYLRI
jgi:predicted acyltransferase